MNTAALNRRTIRILPEFVCPKTEQDYRRQRLPEDIRLGFVCACGVLIGSVLHLLGAIHLYSLEGPLLLVLVLRGAIVLATLGLMAFLRNSKNPKTFDRWLTMWASLVSICNLVFVGSNTFGDYGQAAMSLGIPLAAYCVLPISLASQLLIVLPFSLGALYLAAVTGLDPFTLRMMAGAYFISNVLGSFTSWQLNQSRRRVYLAGVRETELRSHLEQALAEVKTLRGLLPICAWCKRIRDEEQAWQSLEMYVQKHSHAKFTHGICEECFREKLAGELEDFEQPASAG